MNEALQPLALGDETTGNNQRDRGRHGRGTSVSDSPLRTRVADPAIDPQSKRSQRASTVARQMPEGGFAAAGDQRVAYLGFVRLGARGTDAHNHGEAIGFAVTEVDGSCSNSFLWLDVSALP